MKDLLEGLADLWMYLKKTRNIYISLFLAFLFLIGALVMITESTAIMPFIYTLF